MQSLLNQLERALNIIFSPHDLTDLSEFVFGTREKRITAKGLIQRADKQDNIQELYSVASLLSGNRHELFRLKERIDHAYRIILERRISTRPYLNGNQLVENIPKVCRIELSGRAIGSGFLVGRDLVISNHHVLLTSGNLINRPGELRFRFEFGGDTRAGKDGNTFTLVEKNALVAYSARDRLDYALVRISGNAGNKFNWFIPQDFKISLEDCDHAYIIQCPRGEPPSVAHGPIASRFVLSRRGHVLYLIDTDEGSSGSPCVQQDGRLLALHRGSMKGGNHGVFFPDIVHDIIRQAPDRLQGFGFRENLSSSSFQRRSVSRSTEITGLESQGSEPVNLTPPPRPKPGPVTDYTDPQKGRWGGKSHRDGRKLKYIPDETSTTRATLWFDLQVYSTDQTPLVGPVVFHLHDSYDRSVLRITKINGEKYAVLKEISANETFTVGAQVLNAKNEWVSLELDLNKLREIPSRFRY